MRGRKGFASRRLRQKRVKTPTIRNVILCRSAQLPPFYWQNSPQCDPEQMIHRKIRATLLQCMQTALAGDISENHGFKMGYDVRLCH
jgi:hypothetical protein